jgi:ankyrin repeat protein
VSAQVPDGRANAVDERDPDVRTTEVNFPMSPTASKELFIQAASKLYGVDPSQVNYEESDEDESDEDESDEDESDEDKSDEKSDDEIKHWIYTAQIGDLVGLTRHLEQGIDINSSIERDGVTDGLSALHWAARNGHLQIVKILVEKGAVVDSATITDRYTPLTLAIVSGGHFEVAKFLVEKGAKIDSMDAQGSSLLHGASAGGYLQLAKFLVEKGARIDSVTMHGLTLLHFVASREKCWERKGAEEENATKRKCSLEVAKFLVEKGADISLVCNFGCSVLSCAAVYGHIELAKWLMEIGAVLDLDDKDKGMIHSVAAMGHLNVVKWLVEQGAKIDTPRVDGRTPFHCAVKGATTHEDCSSTAVVEWLATCATTFKILDAFTTDILSEAQGLSPEKKVEVTPIIKRLMTIKAVRTRKLQKAGERLVQARACETTGQERSDHLLEAGKAVSWVLEHLTEDEEASLLDAEIAQEQERASEAAMSALLSECNMEEAGAKCTKKKTKGKTNKEGTAMKAHEQSMANERGQAAKTLAVEERATEVVTEVAVEVAEAVTQVGLEAGMDGDDVDFMLHEAVVSEGDEHALQLAISNAKMHAERGGWSLEYFPGWKRATRKLKQLTSPPVTVMDAVAGLGTTMKAHEQSMANEHGQAAKTLAAEERATETVTEVAAEVADAVAQVDLEAGMDGDHSEWTVEEVVEWTQGQEQPQLYQPKLRRQRAL